MDQLSQIFMYEGKQVRTQVINGELHWVAKDVTDILEIDPTQIRRLDEDEKVLCSIQTLGGTQQMTVINESGLYALILGSKKVEAKPFKRWVTHEVLPSIRKTGSYNVHQMPQSFAEALEGYAAQLRLTEAIDAERKQLATQIAADRPKVLFAESLQVSNDSILIGELAKLLKQNGIDIGGTRLFRLLREEGYLMSKGDQYNMPTQRSMDLKIMEIKAGTRGGSDGAVHITRTTKITGKGQIYFVNKFKTLAHAQ